jgi:hypothetical protein
MGPLSSRVRRLEGELLDDQFVGDEPHEVAVNLPPSRASKACTWPVMPSGTRHRAIASGSSSAQYAAARGARITQDTRVVYTTRP